MEISQALLGLMFSIAVGVGALLGFVYDVFRFFRVLVWGEASLTSQKMGAGRSFVKGAAVFFQDVLFCVLSAVALLLLLYYTNDGQFRGLALIGIAAGLFVYFCTVGRLFSKLFSRMAVTVRRALAALLKLLLLPFKLIFKAYQATVGKVIRSIRVKIVKIKDEKYTAKITEQYRARAKEGFGIAVFDKNTDG